MMSNPALIVPIDVAALCVGNDDAHGDTTLYGVKDFAAIASEFANLPYVDAGGVAHNSTTANISDEVLPTAFAPVASPLSTGIHLHWALPDALTHGVQDKASGKIVFPPAPNRWLVVRTASSWANPAAPTTAFAAWVIESDHLWDADQVADPLAQNKMSRAVLLEPILSGYPNKSYQTLGRVFKLSNWQGDAGSNYLAKLTAVGYGLPSYAAVYDHGPNVYGFNDILDDVDLAAFAPGSSSLAYAVVGWYADLTKDPLRSFEYPDKLDELYPQYKTEVEKKAAAIADALNWTYKADGDALPDRIVCNGVLCGVPWDPGRKYLQKQAANVQVAIGNTTAEAVSALVAERNPNLPGLETILNCFQLGLLERLEAPGGSAEADESLHQAAYGSFSGGAIWTLQPVTPANKDPNQQTSVITSDDDLLAAASRAAPLDPEIATLLNTLNIAQQGYDGLAADVAARRGQIFADWYKYMKADYWELQTAPPVSSQDAFSYINNFAIPALNKQISALSDKQTDVNTALSALKAKLPASFNVIAVDGPRYWLGNDPVILITGEDAQASPRYGGDGDGDPNGNLACRLSTQIVDSIDISGKTPLSAKAADLPALTGAAANVLPPEALPLVSETFFVDPDRAPVLAKIAGATLSSSDLANLTQTIKNSQQTLLTGTMPTGSVTFSGVAPSPVGLNAWSEPWIPLMLQWEVHFYPMKPVGINAGADYGADFISSNFAIDPNDIHLKPTGALPGGNYQSYQGSLVLAGNPQINLASQVDRYFKNHPEDPDAKEIEQIKDQLNISGMAQTLDGFNQQLMMRAQRLQLPVFDPLAALRHGFMRGQFCNVTAPAAVGDENGLAALPQNSYNPLRTGSFQVVRLRLIDAFGQVREIDNPATIVASSLKPPSGADGQIFLPPRIAQPARLLFRWISATDDQVETNSHPAATPVCGWVLFNHLDTSLMIYGADGAALGSLNVQGPLWQSAPGAGAMISDPTVSLANANRHLRTFAMSAYAQGANFLTALLNVIDAQMTTINPLGYKQNQGLSLLIGQPLALVRASLRLELLGRPMLDESWPAFTQAVQASNVDSRPCANLTGVRFPVRLGDLGKLADGLIGYFIDDGSDTLKPFYAGAAQPNSVSGVAQLDPNKVALTPVASSDQSPSLMLSMLVDPRGAVHATTGILPVKDISIPPDMYSDTLSRLAVTFLNAPVIGGGPSISMPLPNENGYAWSWVTHPPGTEWATQPETPAASVPGKAIWPQRIEEGWLKLTPATQTNNGNQ